MISEPYHPVIQLRFGEDSFIITIPPEHLVEFTATEVRGGRDRASIVFIDPTFVRLEALLLQLDRNTAKARSKKQIKADVLFYRWGFPGLGLEKRPWKQGIIATYTPTLTTSGMRIAVELWATGLKFAYIVEPKTYYGKISDVVKKVGRDMGYPDSNILVEETDDDENDVSNQPWAIKNMSPLDFLEGMVKHARSKKNPQYPYHLKFANDGTLRFHTNGYNQAKNKAGTPRVFKTLFGDPETPVSDFSASYNSKRIGNIAQSVLATTYDPRTKQYQKRVLTRKSMALGTKEDPNNARTTAGPLVTSDEETDQEKKVNAAVYKQSQQVALGGACSGKTRHPYTSPEAAFKYIEHSFKILHSTISSAQMELVGLPGLEDFTADELYCDVHVVLPPSAVVEAISTGATQDIDQVLSKFGLEPNYGLHWSSGRYQIKTVTHTITSGYTISVELFRPTMLSGPDEARTGAPKKPQLTTVKTT